MQCPTPTAFGRITAGDQRHLGFDLSVELEGPATARLLEEQISNGGILLFLISIPYVI